MAMRMRVLSLCDYTGNMVKPWSEAGHSCTCIDLQTHDRIEPNITYIKGDVRDMGLFEPGEYDIVFAFPPCTHTAVSGARWFKSKGPRAASQAFGILAACLDIIEQLGCPWMVENPVSTFSTYWRKPDYIFDPCDYGDPYTKKTCLWTGGGFVMPPKNRVEPTQGSKMHLLPPSADRANIRSATPMGFARAVFESNSPIRAERNSNNEQQ